MDRVKPITTPLANCNNISIHYGALFNVPTLYRALYLFICNVEAFHYVIITRSKIMFALNKVTIACMLQP